MAKITPNMEEAVDFSALPAGQYKVRITGDEVKTAKKSGAPYVAWKMTVFGAEGEAEQYNGRVLFHNTMLSGKGAGGFRSLWMAVNNITDVSEVPTALDCDTEDFLSKEVFVTVGQREYEGNTMNEVKAVAPIA